MAQTYYTEKNLTDVMSLSYETAKTTMPVEVLTREELERLIRELSARLLEESGLSKRLSDLEASVNEVKNAISRQVSAPTPEPTYQALISDLGERARLLDIDLEKEPITMRVKQWLRFEDFRAVSEVVKKHGGTWSPEKRAFILRITRPESR